MNRFALLVARRLAAHGVVVDPDLVDDVINWNFGGAIFPACLKLDTKSDQLMLISGPLLPLHGMEVRDNFANLDAALCANRHLAKGRFSGGEAIFYEESVSLTGNDDADASLVDDLLGLTDLFVCTGAFDYA